MKVPRRDVIRSLAERRMGRPLLAIVGGSAGLAAALREQWTTLAIQRCTAHKLRNLEAKAPVRMREELAEEYRRMIYAESRTLVDQARTRFAKKWRLRCLAVVECLEEAGDDLFTFFALSEDAVEGVADDQCPGADQRRVSTPHQNASESARTRGRPHDLDHLGAAAISIQGRDAKRRRRVIDEKARRAADRRGHRRCRGVSRVVDTVRMDCPIRVRSVRVARIDLRRE